MSARLLLGAVNTGFRAPCLALPLVSGGDGYCDGLRRFYPWWAVVTTVNLDALVGAALRLLGGLPCAAPALRRLKRRAARLLGAVRCGAAALLDEVPRIVRRSDPAGARRLTELVLRHRAEMEERLARLAPGVGVLEVCGSSAMEVNERD